MDFEYKISNKNHFVVITFTGKITKDSRIHFETCHKELVSFEKKTVVLYMKDVSGIEIAMSRELTLLQQELRKKNKNLYVVGLNFTLKQELNFRGLLRQSELKSTLEEVLICA